MKIFKIPDSAINALKVNSQCSEDLSFYSSLCRVLAIISTILCFIITFVLPLIILINSVKYLSSIAFISSIIIIALISIILCVIIYLTIMLISTLIKSQQEIIENLSIIARSFTYTNIEPKLDSDTKKIIFENSNFND